MKFIEKHTLLQIAFLMALLVSLPKLIFALNGSHLRANIPSEWLDFTLQFIFSYLYVCLFLYLNTFYSLNIWKKIALFLVLHIVCTFIFANLHIRILGITERTPLVRLGYQFRNVLLLVSAVLVSNFLKTLQQKQALSLKNKSLEAENLKAQLNTLQQQLNPHFLFNSLNSLHSLIQEDAGKSQEFVQKLSLVLRYSLDFQKKELVSIAEELTFLEAYTYLLKIRFGEKLTIEYQNFDKIKGLVPPLSLQLLIENAVNHNEISTQHPLSIFIHFDVKNAIISVKNNLNPKRKPSEGAGLGLYNLDNRYMLLSQKHIDIQQDAHSFKVNIPVLAHDHFNH
jgi:two-component system, LytTR family, sensor kinase